MIEAVYQALILSGLIILGVLYYLRKISKNFLLVVTEIMKMNEINEYDPVKFTENLPPLMDKLGVQSYSYYIMFLDTEYQKTADHKKNSIKKFVCTQEFTVYVEVSPGRLRWERAHLAYLLVDIIFILLKIDVTMNLRATTKALTELGKINTFLTHDIKNLAQFIGIMDHNLSNTKTPEQKDKLFGYLKNTAPSLKMRSDRVLMSLSENAKAYLPEKEYVNPYNTAANIARILGADLEYKDDGIEYLLEKKGIIVIFENIIKNFYDKSITQPGIKLKMAVDAENEHITISFTDSGSKIVNTEQIFEPFFSEKKGGLGIGLYHCRNIVKNMHGKMWAENRPEGPAFLIKLKNTK